MKLKTSFFNFRVLLKNLTRFAPLWVLYAVGEVLGLMLLNLDNEAHIIANDLSYLMGSVAIFHAGYALLVAACLFGDLFDSRLCNGLHAMPMRREGWLITNLASGLVFALIPAIVGGGVAALFLEKDWWMALVWQGTSLLQFVFFFGLAVFSAMCAGKRLGMFAVYGILNFLSMLIYWVADKIFVPLLPGVVTSDYWFAKLCPLLSFLGSTYVDYYGDAILGGFFRGFYMENLYYLYICAGVGVVFLLLAWLLYRKRDLEKAGDFIAFRPAGICFLLSYTFALGVLLYSFGDLLGWYRDYGFLVVGILIGWFTGWMLLERTVKIFNKRVLLGLGVFGVLLAGSLGLTMLDPLGVVTYVPETENITAANLYMQNDIYYYESSDGWDGFHITDPDEIAWAQELHRSMLESAVVTEEAGKRTYFTDRLRRMVGKVEMDEAEYVTTYVHYRLKNGREVSRTYKIPVESRAMEQLRPFLSDIRSVLSVTDFEQVRANVENITVYYHGGDDYIEISDHAWQQELIAAIEADSKAGTMIQHSFFHGEEDTVASVDISWSFIYKVTGVGDISGTRGNHIAVYKDCAHTLAFLETLLKK